MVRPLAERIRHREEVKRWKKKNAAKVRAYARRNYAQNRAKFCARSRKNYRQSPEIRLRADLKARYDMTLEEFNLLLAEQNGVCAICGLPETGKFSRLSVDHDHSDNSIRGLLCSACNSGIGRLKDDPELLIRAADYLRKAEEKAKDGPNRNRCQRKVS
jgi:Autographiviridae endonuclease VII